MADAKLGTRTPIHVAIHYLGCEPFEVEALSEERLRQLIVVECQDRGWLVEDSWREELS